MKNLCIWLVRFYRRFLSPLKRTPTCRFTPTCSAYAIDAFTKRGFFMGMILTVWRILRCNPFCPGGYDPVPQHGFPTRGYYSIPGNEITPDDDTTEQLAPHDTDAPAQPKLICEDYVLRRSHKAPVKEQPPQHRAE